MLLRQGSVWLAAATWLLLSAGGASAWCVVGVERGDALHIRTGPTPFNPIVADIHPKACGVKVVGPCFAGWCPVAFRGRSGWSNSYYLVSETMPGPRRFAQREFDPSRSRPAPVTRAAATKLAAVSPKRSAPPAPVREAPVEPPKPAPVAAPAPKQPPDAAPEQRALSSVGAAREVCVQGVPRGDTLKVRAGPAANTDLRYGFLPDTCGVKITGDCKDGWCPVEYRGYKGWAEQKNLQ